MPKDNSGEKVVLRFTKATPPHIRRLLRNKDEFSELVRKRLSLKELKAMGVNKHQYTKARRFHGIPPMIVNMPRADIEGMTPREILGSPAAKETLMFRVHTQAGVCPDECRLYGLQGCPRPELEAAMAEDDSDDFVDPRAMPADCPVAFYLGTGRNGDGPIFEAFKRAAATLDGWQEATERLAEATTQASEERPEADPVDEFRATLMATLMAMAMPQQETA